MTLADDDFHDFVVGFADPLARLAFVLLAGTGDRVDDELTARRSAFTALAQTRRHWRNVQETGAPEPIAVESLLSQLSRKSRHSSPKAELAELGGEREHEGDEPRDVQAIRDAFWRAWRTLDPRERVPFVFGDVSLISPRLAGLDVPGAFASPRRLYALAATGTAHLTAALERDPDIGDDLESLDQRFGEAAFDRLLAETLHERAVAVAAPIDPYTLVLTGVRQMRRRTAFSAAAAVAVLIGATLAVLSVSTSRQSTSPQAVAATARAHPEQTSAASAASDTPTPRHDIVVDWPTRGDARDDATLLSNVRSAFVLAHPDAVGQVQILLATDTPWFRIAYVTAQSPTGIVQSWFYGPVHSEDLVEGASMYGGTLLHDSVLGAALSDRNGHVVMVVIGPPDTTDIRLADFDFTKPPTGFAEVAHPDGIAVLDVSHMYVPALFLRVTEGNFVGWNGEVPLIQLTSVAALTGDPQTWPNDSGVGGLVAPPGASGSTPNFMTRSVPNASGVTVERGSPDPGVLRAALFAEHQWVQTGSLSASGVPVVLWGGSDSSGSRGVVLRVKTLHLSDLVIVAWSQTPNSTAAFRLAPDAPDFPFAFMYESPDGARVGVIAPPGVAKAGLVVDGIDLGETPVDPTGFASMLVGSQYGLLGEQTLEVDLFDSAGHQVSRVPVTPYA